MTRKNLMLFTAFIMMAIMFVGCSKDDNDDINQVKSPIVGEWQLISISAHTVEGGVKGEVETVDYSSSDNMSVLKFTSDYKVEFKVYEKTESGEVQLNQHTGSYVDEDGKIKIIYSEQDENQFSFDEYKINGNTLTLTSTIGADPLIFSTTYTAKRLK